VKPQFTPGDRLTNRRYPSDVRYVTRADGEYVYTTDVPGGQREHVMQASYYAKHFDRSGAQEHQ
jgi:hypothetical protein